LEASQDYGADCALSIRGTTNTANWIRDLEVVHERFVDANGSCPDCRVEYGFYEVWRKARDAVVSHLESLGCKPNTANNRVYVSGHSLGAAVAALGMFSLADRGFQIQRSFLMESPLPGNKAFADAFDKRFPSTFRLTHGKDVVVHVPMWYVNPFTGGFSTFGTEIFYSSSSSEFKVCDGLWDKSCSFQYPVLVTPKSIADHCSVPYAINGDICSCPI